MIIEMICGTVTVVTVSSLLFARWAMKFQFYTSPEEIERQRIYDDEMSFKEQQEEDRKRLEQEEEKKRIEKEKENSRLKAEKTIAALKNERCTSLYMFDYNQHRCTLNVNHFGPHTAKAWRNSDRELWWEGK